MDRRLTCALVFLIAVAAYAVTYDAEFVFDDSEALVSNKDVTQSTSFYDIFTHDFWGSNIASNLSHKSYRPLTILSFR
jgi:hypothetical protein